MILLAMMEVVVACWFVPGGGNAGGSCERTIGIEEGLMIIEIVALVVMGSGPVKPVLLESKVSAKMNCEIKAFRKKMKLVPYTYKATPSPQDEKNIGYSLYVRCD